MTASEMVARAKDLQPVPHVALKLLALLDEPSVSNHEVVRVLKCDSVLTAKLLHACNASAFALKEPAASVDQAVLMLGHQQILQMVLTLSFRGAMMAPMPAYAVEAEEFWRHALTTATAAEIIAMEGPGLAEHSVAFTSGLLHDIGKLVLCQFIQPESERAMRQLIGQRHFSRIKAEKEILGADHCETGACLLEKWQIPPEIVEVAANHHHPRVRPRPRLSALAHVANCIAHLTGSAPGWEAYALHADDEAARALGISGGELESLVVRVRDSFQRVNQLMSIE